jgi:ADP-ribosylation factor GTPase-activating protein 2/3
MGVHTTFVRSVDLDEWTQRQVDAMRLGGNDNARKFFRKNGVDMHVKIDKKYISKAAQLYRQELDKLVSAEAAKRGEGDKPSATAAVDSAVTTASLLENLSLAEQEEATAVAKERLAAARATAVGPAQSVAKTAAEMHGKGRLLTPPSSGNAPTVVLRAPGNISKNFLKKKASASTMAGTKLRVNKLSTTADADTAFEDVDDTQTKTAPAEPVLPAEDSEHAHESAPNASESSNGAAESSEPNPAAKYDSGSASQQHVGTTMEAGVAKLQQMNNDFFSGM